MSDKRTTSMDSPQWCVLSPQLYTNDCKSSYPGRQLIKIADNTALVRLIQDEEKEHGPVLENFVKWCDDSLSAEHKKKRKETHIDCRGNITPSPLTVVQGQYIEVV